MAPLLDILTDTYKKMPNEFLGDPVAEIKNRIHVSPFHEDDVHGLSKLIGIDKVLFGSDYPHPEGLEQPTSMVDVLDDFSEEDKAMFMGGNLARLLSL